MTFVDLAKVPELRVRLRAGWHLGRSADGTGLEIRAAEGWTCRLADYVPSYDAARARLTAGAPLAELRDIVLHQGGALEAATWLIALQDLFRAGGLEFPLVDETGERATIVPRWSAFVPVLPPHAPPGEHRIDRFAYIRRDGVAWTVESPLSGARLTMTDLAALEAPVVRRALAGAGLLENGPPENEARQRALAQWEFHDLLFHVRHREGWHRCPVGGKFPFIGEIDPLAARRPPWPGERIELPLARDASDKKSFASVLGRRRSERVYDEAEPITLQDLGALLDRVARIRSTKVIPVGAAKERAVDFEVTRRPYPSGGAIYELEIYPAVDRCAGLKPGVYHYDAGRHELARVAARTSDTQRLITDAARAIGDSAVPQIVLVIAARFERVMWKYRSISYGLILRNVGVLYQTLYLAATELGLSPCGIGSGDSALFARVTNLDPVVEGSVGEFALGGRPARGAGPSPRSAAGSWEGRNA